MEHVASREERTWAMICHLSALAGYFTFIGFFVAPLIVWLVKRDDLPLVNDQGREALNFQLSVLIYAAIAALLILVIIGIPLLIALGVFQFTMIIVAGVRAGNGERFRYPLTMRMIR